MIIEPIAARINQMSLGRSFGELQEIRRILKGLHQRASRTPFAGRSIFDQYAFHLGGRSEIQFNIGIEGETLRHGLAFSLEPGMNLTEPARTLRSHILRFNDFVNQDRERYARFRQWHWDGDDRSENSASLTVVPALIRDGVFIFFGSVQQLHYTPDGGINYDSVDYETILNDFDDLLDIYIYVESADGTPAGLPGASSLCSEPVAHRE